MASRNWDSQHFRQEIARLTAPGVLGFYTHLEATEVFAVPAGQSAALNVFSIFVAEERQVGASEEPRYLCAPIKLKSLKGWTFGIKRYAKPVGELLPLFDNLGDGSEWRPSGEPLNIGEVVSVATQFVPPDQSGATPWNRVLKNNFWNGAHILEWVNLKKDALKPLFDKPPRLQELSDAVRAHVPLGLASLSDRFANIVMQLPLTVVIAKFGRMQAGDFVVSLGWHPKATPRPLRASCELPYDNAISAYMSANVAAPQTLLPMHDGRGLHRAFVWDEENRTIIGASGDLGFISAAGMKLRVMDHEPRVFMRRDENGVEQQVRVTVIATTVTNMVGEPAASPAGEWTDRRLYRDEIARVKGELRFVQYKPEPGKRHVKHEEALRDIRRLLNWHGEKGAWLWDPYLSAEDILDTLFRCSFSGADLRALTAGRVPLTDDECPPQGTPADGAAPSLSFAEKQRAAIADAKSNLHGLRLEYRIRTGRAGWAFHDRFLIFPASERGALAWSLGTSVNSLGRQHHILQRVDDGQLVADAFLELWNELDRPENLVWKTT